MSIDQLQQYRKKVQEIAAQEGTKEKGREAGGNNDEPPLEFVKECYNANEVGDSLLYNFLHRDRYISNVIAKFEDSWMKYMGPHWDDDFHKQSTSDVEQVALQYLRMLPEIEEALSGLEGTKNSDPDKKMWLAKRKDLLERVKKLRSYRGRNAVLGCAVSNSDPLTVHPDQLDQYPWLLPVENGIIDLSTGEFTEGGDPSLFLTMAAPTKWTGLDTPCPHWEQYLRDVLDNDQEVIDYLQRILGYSITGLRSERLFVVFYGPHGQNGKGTLIETVDSVLGNFAAPVETELLMSQRFAKSTSGPSPELMALKAKRIIYASETEKNHSFAAGKIKRFSGGDKIIGRGLQASKQTIFYPSYVLYLICNDLPSAPPRDSAFWERIKVFLFPFSFLPNPTEEHHRPVNRDLPKHLEAERSGILAWLVRGCLEWQRKGLIPPAKVVSDSKNYREHEDDLQHFLEECCHINMDDASKDNRIQSSTIYSLFKQWWEANNSTRAMNQKDFSTQLQQKGYIKVKDDKIFYQFLTPKIDAGGI